MGHDEPSLEITPSAWRRWSNCQMVWSERAQAAVSVRFFCGSPCTASSSAPLPARARRGRRRRGRQWPSATCSSLKALHQPGCASAGPASRPRAAALSRTSTRARFVVRRCFQCCRVVEVGEQRFCSIVSDATAGGDLEAGRRDLVVLVWRGDVWRRQRTGGAYWEVGGKRNELRAP